MGRQSGSAKAFAGGMLGGLVAGLVTLFSVWIIARLRPSGVQMLAGVGSIFLMATASAAGCFARRTGRTLPTALGVVAGEAALATALLVLDSRLSTFSSPSSRSEALGYSLVLVLTVVGVVGGGAALAGATVGRRGRTS